MMQTPPRPLLVTLTREPFQPVRLSYTIPNKAFVTARLRPLQCVVEAPREQCWQWLFEAEAKALEFGGGYDQVPPGARPIVLGRLRFPKRGGMVLQTNSVLRAIGGARFFSTCLGPQVVATRVRIVNRLFSSDDGAPDDLMKTLDTGACSGSWAAARRDLLGARRGGRPPCAGCDGCVALRARSEGGAAHTDGAPIAPRAGRRRARCHRSRGRSLPKWATGRCDGRPLPATRPRGGR